MTTLQSLIDDAPALASSDDTRHGSGPGVQEERAMKFDIIAGIQYPHRLACAKSAEEVVLWLKENDYVRLSEFRLGLAITEVTVIPRATYERRAHLHRKGGA